MFQTAVKVRVRYAETDQMGYVYYGNYATYYEVGRVEALRKIGLSYKELEKRGVMMPVLDSQSKFLKPGKYDELLTIKVKIPEKPRARILFEYDIHNESGVLIHQGKTTLVFVNMDSGRPVRTPKELENLLIPFFED